MAAGYCPVVFPAQNKEWLNMTSLERTQQGEKCSTLVAMYEDFHVTDHWTQEDLHCRWTANVVAIATRHADAIDVRFEVNGRPVWIAMPAHAWVEQKKRSGHVITDRLAAQVAGHYLKQAVESGYDNGREMYTCLLYTSRCV